MVDLNIFTINNHFIYRLLNIFKLNYIVKLSTLLANNDGCMNDLLIFSIIIVIF